MARPAESVSTGPRLNLPIFLLALLGVLVVVHLWVQGRADFVFGCTGAGDAASGSGCASVTSSAYSSFLGVSLLVWGGLFYAALAALRFGVAALQPPTSETLRKVSFGVATAGFLFALYLVSVQAFVLEQFCVLCLISSLTTATIFALHLVERVKGPGPAVALGAALRPYAIAAVALVVLAGADVLLTPDATAPAPVVADPAGQSVQATLAAGGLSASCRFDVEVPRFGEFDRLITLETPYEGEADAPIRVVKIFDPNCPHCKTLHQQLGSVIPQLEERAKFFYKPFAIWEYSVPQIQALYLAGEEGKFFEMLDQQFLAQQPGGLSLDQLVAAAERIGMDGQALRQEIEARKYVGLIEDQNALVRQTGLNSVPRLMIEGRMVANVEGAYTPSCLGGLIDLVARDQGVATEAPPAGS